MTAPKFTRLAVLAFIQFSLGVVMAPLTLVQEE
jgi:hypothetical protein